MYTLTMCAFVYWTVTGPIEEEDISLINQTYHKEMSALGREQWCIGCPQSVLLPVKDVVLRKII